MQKIIATLVAACVWLTASAQINITGAEYFIDTDPGFGRATGIAITASPDVKEQSFTVQLDTLAQGIHALYLRSRDAAGKWSITNSRYFYKPAPAGSNSLANITKAEYFFDTDPGFGNGTNIPITAGTDVSNIHFNANLTLLTSGVHVLYLRTRNTNGKWSVTTSRVFYKPDPGGNTTLPNIVQAEYFYDSDPGFGKGTNIPLVAGTHVPVISFNADIAALPPGLHVLFLRSRDANGYWSVTNHRFFYKPANNSPSLPNITQAEYFFDNDPGFGNGMPIAVTPGTHLANVGFTANLQSLSPGIHALHVRSKSADGKWSVTGSRFFYRHAAARQPDIDYVEYFIDNDPGFGKGTAIAINPSTNIAGFVTPVNITGLTAGDHVLYIRSRNARGYSITNAYKFPVAEAVPSTISINAITKQTMCAGDSVKVSFDANGTFAVGNIFTAELSDANGNFGGAPVAIGTLPSTGSGIIDCLVPKNTTAGNNYRIRIKSSDPLITGLPNANPLRIATTPTAPVITGHHAVNAQLTETYTVPLVAGSQWQWLVDGGTQVSGGTGNSVAIRFQQPAGSNGTGSIKVIENRLSGCVSDTGRLTVAVYQPSITNTPGATTLCKNGLLTIPFTVNGATYSGNVYTAQLSDAAGSFATPVNIGSITANGAGLGQQHSINAMIPANIAAANGYRIRIVSSLPIITGAANSTSLTVNEGLPAPTAVVTQQPGCVNGTGSIEVTAPVGEGIQYSIGGAYQSSPVFAGITANTYTITAKNAEGCVSPATSLTVTAQNSPVPTITASGPLSFCQGGSVVLTSSAGSGNRWSTGATTKSITVTTAGQYSVTVGQGACATTSVAVAVQVTPSTRATFAPIAPVCAGLPAPALPTTSQNGITGSWSPATISNTASGSYVFTPASGQCIETTTIQVIVQQPVTPLFNIPASVTAGATPPVLPATSINGIAGSWSPATVNNAQTGTYTFTPHAGQCANSRRITIEVKTYPDISVREVTTQQLQVAPLDTITLSWHVDNIGTAAAPVDWTERIYVQATNGTNRTLLKQQVFQLNNTIAAGQSLTRTTSVVIPAQLSIGNHGVLVVELRPGNMLAEAAGTAANNTGLQATALTFQKVLTLALSSLQVTEGAAAGIEVTVNRSASLAEALTVQLAMNMPQRFTMPSTITIAAGQAGASFTLYAVDNTAIEGTIRDTLRATAPEYAPAQAAVEVADNDKPSLYITQLPNEISEGSAGIFKVHTNFAPSAPLQVYVTANNPARLPLPPVVTIPAGQLLVDVPYSLPQNTTPEVDLNVEVQAGAANHLPAKMVTLVTDDDVPGLVLELQTGTIAESAGFYATQATLRRTPGSNAIAFAADLKASIANTLILPARLTLSANENAKTFTIGVLDNNTVEGDRTVTLTASVFVTSCGCSAPATSAGTVTANLIVTDNDGPAITLLATPLTLAEGQANAGTLRISRNTSTAASLKVHLTSLNENEATVPASVTIPAGAAFTEVPITTVNDGIADGNKQVFIEATASGYAKGSVWVMVTDQNKPDLQITHATIPTTSMEALALFNYQVAIQNTGFAAAPAGVMVRGYLSADDVLDNNDTLITEDFTTMPVTPGQQVTLVGAASVPNLPGAHRLIFKVNPLSSVTELLMANNHSPAVPVTINPLYTATASVNANYFTKGSRVPITGVAIKSDGTHAGKVPVEVYVITNGLRREISVQTNDAGHYTTEFVPLANEAGSYTVGASYPALKATAAQDTFDILGVLVNNGTIPQFKTIINDTLSGTLPVKNLASTNLTGFTLENVKLPNGAVIQFNTLPLLPANSTTQLGYKVTGKAISPGTKFEVANLKATSNEATIQNVDLFYYCQAPNGMVAANITQVHVTVSPLTQQRLVEFRLYNRGLGASGKVTLGLPNAQWLTAVTPVEIPSLQPGDSALVVLAFTAHNDVPFDYPVKGNIAINSQNGNAFTIPYTFKKVSESTGTARVTVTNQFTYYTNNAPKVQDAFVVIKNYYTGQVYAQGLTNNHGVFEAGNIPEGTHAVVVTKDKHLPYNGTVTINPGGVATASVFLNYQAITFSWSVVPTAVQDQYDITLTTKFETHVPVPVVIIAMPKTMPQLSGNNTYAFNVTLTNHGLITAKDVTLNLPKGDTEYEFITNYAPADLLAQQSIQVPVIMRRRQTAPGVAGRPSLEDISNFLGIQPPAKRNDDVRCTDFTGVVYWYTCGITSGLWEKGGTVFTYEGRSCLPTSGGGSGGGVDPKVWGMYQEAFPNCASCPNPDIFAGDPKWQHPNTTQKKSCIECISDLINAAASCATGGVAGAIGSASCTVSHGMGGGSVGGAFGNCMPYPAPGPVGCTKGIVGAFTTCANTTTGGRGMGKIKQRANGSTLGEPFLAIGRNLQVVIDFYDARDQWSTEYFGNLATMDGFAGLAPMIEPAVYNLDTFNIHMRTGILESMKGFDIDTVLLKAFFVRWNQSVEARAKGILEPNSTYPHIINWNKVKAYADTITAKNNKATALGYADILDMFQKERAALDQLLDVQNSAVCASVTVQFSQKLTMTREAFEGTLDIFNGHPTDKMDSLSVNIQVTDEAGAPANGLFEIQVKSLQNLQNVHGQGTINAQQHGMVKYLFIPEKGAAPVTPKKYHFGGSVRYFDPYAQAMVTMPLSDVELTVNPSPDLFLHYFLERNILGDDPLTTPDIEPSIPAELAVMVENQGYGPAVNMTISSAQPKIIENEKGLAIHFKLVGSNLQGKPVNLGVTNINMGTIPPLQSRIGQWYLTSSLLGKFVSYDAKVVHANSFGNPELSLVKGIKLHELTRSIRLYGALEDGITDFLVNDVFDVNDVPDMIYYSQGNRTAKVYEATGGNFDKPVQQPGFTNTLTVTASAAGWNYIKLPDPGNNRFEIQSVTRSDGQVIPLNNAWLTFVTLPLGKQPVYQNRFHFVDTFATVQPVTYTITWKPKNTHVPKVDSISGAPTEVSDTPVQQLTVKFNKAIDPATFTWEDLTLTFQGGPNIMNNSVVITQADTSTFMVNIAALTTGNGLYAFTVQAAGVQDVYGISGAAGKQVTWSQFLGVPTVQSFLSLPESRIARSYDTVQVVFNLPVDATSATPQRFRIYKNNELLQGLLTIDSISTDGKRYYLSGLGNILTGNGAYQLVVDLPNIKTIDGVPGAAAQSVTLTVDNTGPAMVQLNRHFSGGIDAQHVSAISMLFDEDVYGFNTAALRLTHNGNTVPLNMAQLSNTSLTNWSLANFGLSTYHDGDYLLTIDLTAVEDVTGNKGTGTAQLAWTVNRNLVVAVTGLAITPDAGHSHSDNITSGSEFTLGFTLGAAAAQVAISQADPGGEAVLAILTGVAAGQVSVPLVLHTGGSIQLKVTATGEAGGAGTATLPLFVDRVPLSGSWQMASNERLQLQPDTVVLSLSHKLLQPASLPANLQLWRNGAQVTPAQLRATPVNDTAWYISGIRNSSSQPGNYQLRLNLPGLQKHSSGMAGEGTLTAQWTLQSPNRAPVARAGNHRLVQNIGTVQLNGSLSNDPDNDAITYRWIAPQGIVLDDSSVATPSFTITAAHQHKTYQFLLIVSDGDLFSTSAVNVEVKLVLPSINNLLVQYCTSAQAVQLTGMPAGGVFDGPGITGNSFNPAVAGVGVHTIRYSKDGLTTTVQTTVYATPNLGADTTITLACEGGTANLTTLYSTTGYTTVAYSSPAPQQAGPGVYRLAVANNGGCTDTAWITVQPAVVHTVATQPSLTLTANRECTDADGWTHYYHDNGTPGDASDDTRLLSIQKNGNDIGHTGDGTFTLTVAATAAAGSGQATEVTSPLVPTVARFIAMNRYWNVVPARQPATPVGIRYYYNAQDSIDLQGTLQRDKLQHAMMVMYKTQGGSPNPSTNWSNATSIDYLPMDVQNQPGKWTHTPLNSGVHQAAFQVSSLGGGGGGVLVYQVLPVQLMEFTARHQGNRVAVQWTTASEANSHRFVVQRSTDGRSFTTIGTVQAAGNSSALLHYQYPDVEAPQLLKGKLVYYRLAMVDRDGSIRHSDVRMVQMAGNQPALQLAYNPVNHEALLNYTSPAAGRIVVTVTDMGGRTLLAKTFTVNAGSNQLRLPTAQLPQGVFEVVLMRSNERLHVRMVKQ